MARVENSAFGRRKVKVAIITVSVSYGAGRVIGAYGKIWGRERIIYLVDTLIRKNERL